MKKTFLNIMMLSLLLSSCSISNSNSNSNLDQSIDQNAPQVGALLACPKLKPEVCTMDYNPVCGFDKQGKKVKTFSNSCSACAADGVYGFSKSECSQ